MIRATTGLALLLAGALAGCSDDGPGRDGASKATGDSAVADAAAVDLASSYTPGPGPYTEASEDVTLKDTARKRDVPVRIFAPSLAAGAGAFPVIIFSHGLGESRASFGYLGRYWARHGYVAIFLTHIGHDDKALKDKGLGAFGATSDVSERPGDLAFALDRLAADGLGSSLVKGRADPKRIAAAGQCAGSTAALSLAGLTVTAADKSKASFKDPRVRVVAALGPQVPGGGMEKYLHDDSWSTVSTPALVVIGEADFTWVPQVKADPAFLQLPFDKIPVAEKYLVAIAGAEHHAFTDSVPWYPAGERDPRHHGWIQQATTAFWDGYLKENTAAIDWLKAKKLQAATGGLCRQDTERQPLEKSESGPHAVKVAAKVVLHDAKRQKDIAVQVSYPDSSGKHPLLLFSHALGGTRADYGPLVKHWVSHGYVCIQPDHSDAGKSGLDGIKDWRTRPVDMSFLLDKLPEIEKKVPDLAGRIDTSRVGAGGFYIGAGTANLLVGTRVYGSGGKSEVFEDPRVDASLALSPTGTGQGLTQDSWKHITRPMLVMTGSKDPSKRTGNPPEWRTEPFLHASPGDKVLVWIEGLDGKYGGLGSEAEPETSLAPLIRSSTQAFWDAHLLGDANARAFLESKLAADGRVKVTTK
jgi:predicted dienelactone hydrolase